MSQQEYVSALHGFSLCLVGSLVHYLWQSFLLCRLDAVLVHIVRSVRP